MQTRIHTQINQIEASAWDALVTDGNPFLQHAFLQALEEHHAVGQRYGWLPQHLAVYDNETLVGATPLYLKHNSYGEFVFDWSWADAYERQGLAYYPKLVSAIPYTPATGERLLTLASPSRDSVRHKLIDAALEHAREQGVSGLHWLFTTDQETTQLETAGLRRRVGVQFHWHNRGYRDFQDFLDTFTSAKRKKLRRERRRVEEAGIEIEVYHGHEIADDLWPVVHEFYASTFFRKSGTPTFSQDCFRAIGQALGERFIVMLASDGTKQSGRGKQYVAGVICYRSDDTLYGRHWGCHEEYHSLHFELCYYQGIDYCISHGLAHFEPGAQGEHKVGRGFEPTLTWSAHWLAHAGFRQAVAEFLKHETGAMLDYRDEMRTHLPYRQNPQGHDA